MADLKNISTSTSGVFAKLPIWAKGVIIIGGAYVLYKLGKGVIDKLGLSPEARDQNQEEQGWNQDLISDSAKTPPTLTKAQMKQIANKIENLLDGYGTRDADLITTFKNAIKNNADFAGVNVAFGVRTIEAGRGIGWISGDEKGTLTQVIQEAAAATLSAINADLQKKGIKYRV